MKYKCRTKLFKKSGEANARRGHENRHGTDEYQKTVLELWGNL